MVVPHTCFGRSAELVSAVTKQWLHDAGFAPRCRLVPDAVNEYGANSAIYTEAILATTTGCHVVGEAAYLRSPESGFLA